MRHVWFQVKLWHIKDEGFSDHLEDWLAELRGHRRRVTQVGPQNPAAHLRSNNN